MNRHTPTIVITGASGFLGSALVKHFADKGWGVRALVRNPSSQKNTKNVQYLEYDLSKPLNNKLLQKADYLVHAAYVKYDKQHPDAFTTNIEAAKQLVALSHKSKLKKSLFISTMSAHEGAVSVYGRQKLAVEKEFSQQNDVVLRSGLIIGNGGIVKQMATFMKSKHMVPLIDGGKQPLQIIALDDLVDTIEKALTGPAHGTYTVATPTVYLYKDFYKALARALGTPVLFVPLPFFVLAGIFKVVALLRLPLGVGMDNANGLKRLVAVDNKADLKKLGVELHSLDQALQNSNIT